MNFGTRLKQLRKAAGMTQEALAQAAGLSTSTVCKMEQQLSFDPSWSTVQALAHALGVRCGAFESQEVKSDEKRKRK